MEKIVFITIYAIIESIYVITCVIAINKIRKNLKTNVEQSTLRKLLLLLLICGIFATILKVFFNNTTLERIVSTAFFICELSVLFSIKENAIDNKFIRSFVNIILAFCFIYIIKLGIQKYNFKEYNIFFVVESLTAGTIALIYFLQLTASISNKNLVDDPITYIMLALYFCFGLPLSYTSSFIFIDVSTIRSELIQSTKALFSLFLVSEIGTICYIAFNLFIIKAMKCTQAPQF